MSYTAISSVADSIDATKQFLFPVDRSRWLRLAIYAFFLGSSSFGSFTNAPTNVGGGGGGGPSTGGPTLSPEAWALIVAVVVALVILAFVFSYLASVTEFAFVQALRDDEVSVRSQMRANLGNGLRLFGFQLLFFLGVMAIIVVPVVLLFVLAGGVAILALLVAIPVFFVVMLLVGVVNILTTDFVVPIMLAEDETILGGWQRLWPLVKANLGDTAVYVVMLYIIQFAVGIGVFIVLGLLGVLLAIPFGAAGFAVYAAAGGGQIGLAVGVVIGLIALVYGLLMLLVGLVVQIPLQTFYRYYQLFVLGDIEAELDLIPEVRESVRADEAAD